MDLSKLRTGELIAAIGGLVLIVCLLFLNWYGVGISVQTPFGDSSVGADFGAWDGQGFLGTLANLVILAAGVAAVGLAVVTAGSRSVALPVAASTLTTTLGIGAVLMVIGRMLLQPGPNGIVDLKYGIFVALVGSVAVAYGGWQGMQEEGTTFSQAGPSARPAPPSATSPPAPAEPSPPPRTEPPPPATPGEPPPSEPPPGGPPAG